MDKNTSKPKDTIEILDFNSIYKDKKIISDLRKLTICSYSGMNHELDSLSSLAKKRKVNAKVISVKRNDKIVGWALLSKEDSDFPFGYSLSGNISNFDAKRDGALFEVFVDPNYRRSGIGSALIKKARKHAGPAQLCIAPHDYKSNKFYEKHKKYKQKRLNSE